MGARKTVFVDGSAGTTGLRIVERLSSRDDLELILLPEDVRKDVARRKEALDRSDVSFLCLPDDAAREAVGLVENPDTVIIDTSTAHRVADGWTYGFPELTGLREAVAHSKRIANPGCHASGFIALVAPLVEAGLLSSSDLLFGYSLTGYSGGGKKMIAEYEAPGRSELLDAPRMYGLGQSHKHLPEMKARCHLEKAPVFCPVVAPYYAGMEVTVPVEADPSRGLTKAGIEDVYRTYYQNGLVFLKDNADESGFLSAGAYAGKDTMEISVWGNEERLILAARFDNLGKGASGAAIQNMNLVLGLPETAGLVI